MAKLIGIILSVGVLSLSLLLLKALGQLPLAELRRRARAGSSKGVCLLKGYGSRGKFSLILIGSISFVWLFHNGLTAWWEILISVIILSAIWIGWSGPKPVGRLWNIADNVALFLCKLLKHLPLPAHPDGSVTTRLYEKSDLIELLEHQLKDKENRIPQAELKTAISILNLSGKKISDAMTPLNKAKFVPQDDQIGPHLLNELHKYSTDCFLVVKDAKAAKPDVVGTLYLADAAALTGGGSVRSAMKPGIEYIDEDLTLTQALGEFLSRKAHVLAVRNGFDELVGVLSLQATLEAVLGSPRINSKPQISVDGDKLTTDEKNSRSRAKS